MWRDGSSFKFPEVMFDIEDDLLGTGKIGGTGI
jgi:hypothetical protein